MKNIIISELELKALLRNAFIQGERYQEDWALEQVGEVDEVTEQDFGEWYDSLELFPLEKTNKKIMSKIFKIPVYWEVYSTIDVEAESLEEALEKFDDFENNQEGYPLPTDWEYIDGSFNREDTEFCKFVNNEI